MRVDIGICDLKSLGVHVGEMGGAVLSPVQWQPLTLWVFLSLPVLEEGELVH